MAESSNDSDLKVEKALLKRALGYSRREIYREEIVDRKTGLPTGEVRKRTVLKHIPPDVRAAMLWLQNRRPDRWKSSPADFEAEQAECDPEDANLL